MLSIFYGSKFFLANWKTCDESLKDSRLEKSNTWGAPAPPIPLRFTGMLSLRYPFLTNCCNALNGNRLATSISKVAAKNTKSLPVIKTKSPIVRLVKKNGVSFWFVWALYFIQPVLNDADEILRMDSAPGLPADVATQIPK